MQELFNEKGGTGWGLLLVDARNVFNMLNREAALWNARVLWPQGSKCLFNTSRCYAALIVQWSKEPLHSHEEVTQGDTLLMPFYAVAVLPLIQLSKGLIDGHKYGTLTTWPVWQN